MRKLTAILGLFALAAVGSISYWAGSRTQAPAKAPAAGAAPAKAAASREILVEAAAVSVQKLPRSITTVGSLRSDETIVVRPEVAGRVAGIAFKEGERVAADSVLLSLDDSVQRAELARAEANLALSRTKHERALELRDKGFISVQAIDEAENNLRVAQAEAQLARARLAKTRIRAPFDGIVGLRQVSPGDYVKEGQDLVNLEKTDPLKMDFRVPEIRHADVRDGQSLQLTVDALPDHLFEGRVYAINPLLDASGRALVIRARVPNPRAQLRPGMFARVRLLTAQSVDSLVVPEESIFTVGEDRFVYRIVEGRAERRKVETGLRAGGKVEIASGLAATDRVVTAGHIKLREGASVRVAGDPAPGSVGKAEASPEPKGRT
ncbi:MAG: efflux RND transporter periplasmic adaptor subunit [Burkholderiales bacterium]